MVHSSLHTLAISGIKLEVHIYCKSTGLWKDGWWVDRKYIFPLGFSSLAQVLLLLDLPINNLITIHLSTNALHAFSYLVSTSVGRFFAFSKNHWFWVLGKNEFQRIGQNPKPWTLRTSQFWFSFFFLNLFSKNWLVSGVLHGEGWFFWGWSLKRKSDVCWIGYQPDLCTQTCYNWLFD
jgi:hypothetical protein